MTDPQQPSPYPYGLRVPQGTPWDTPSPYAYPPPPEPPRRRHTGRIAAIAAGAVLLVAGAVGGTLALTGGHATAPSAAPSTTAVASSGSPDDRFLAALDASGHSAYSYSGSLADVESLGHSVCAAKARTGADAATLAGTISPSPYPYEQAQALVDAAESAYCPGS